MIHLLFVVLVVALVIWVVSYLLSDKIDPFFLKVTYVIGVLIVAFAAWEAFAPLLKGFKL